jgi:TolB-like protein/DNA-binding winged helix-turn-helix (wHTH) protein/Tfp pilus assembly protein PilF
MASEIHGKGANRGKIRAFAEAGFGASFRSPLMPIPSSHRFRFGDGYELDLGAYELRLDGRALRLPRIPMEVLRLLLEQRGNLVTRDEIIERIWGREVFVDTDNSINAAIRKIRQVLKDDADEPRFIQTVPAKGYRFVAVVTEVGIAPGNSSADGETAAEGDGIGGQEKIAPEQIAPEQASLAAVGESPADTKGRGLRKWAIPAMGLLAVAAIGIYASWFHRAASAPPPKRVLLAVLPFANLTGDPAQEYFSDGLTEEMITELGRLDPEHLGVIGRTSVMLYKQNPKPLDQIGRELGVQYVLEGSVRRDSTNVRITAQLIQVKDQTHVWARQYDRELKNLLAVQAEIAQEVTDEITLTLGDRRAATAASHSTVTHAATSYEAYDLYLEGRYFWNKRTEEGFKQAADYFQQAIAKDPNYAQAYAGLADTFGLMSTWYMAPQGEFMPKARAVALKALALDETVAEAHTSLALIAENYDYDWGTAEKEFRRAIQLNPDYPTAHQWYAESLAWQGRFDEAFEESERARQLDPMSLIIVSDYSKILYYSRQYEPAIAQSRAVSAMDGSDGNGIVYLAHIQQGKFAEALTEIPSREEDPRVWAIRAYVYGRWQREKQLQYALGKFEQLASKLGLSRTSVSLMAYAGSGEGAEKDKLFALLQEAYLGRSPALTQIKVDPQYDPLRGDPRFQELLRKVGLTNKSHKS